MLEGERLGRGLARFWRGLGGAEAVKEEMLLAVGVEVQPE